MVPAAAVAAAALCGFACMAAELTAVRLLAPHFGDSAYVWTNVIGVILAALAAGALLGGRWSTRGSPLRPLRLVLLSSGLLLAAASFVAGPLGAWLLPADLPLDAAMPALVRGSFVATALLFAPPLVLLGAVSPLLVAAVVAAGRPVGSAAGAIGAAGTIGSLAGTFAATHWLVPSFGCRVALIAAGSCLLLASLVLVRGARSAAAPGLVLALLVGAAALPRGPLRPPAAGTELLAEVESRAQFLQVHRQGVAGERQTVLVINEGLDSFHSIAIEGSRFTGGRYYDWHAIAPLLAGDGSRPVGLRALSIGDAAGSLRAVYAAVHPGAIVDAVDIDVATMQLGDRWFAGPKADGERFAVDGRVFLQRTQRQWHVIHVDAYAHQVYVPAHLASREFFAAARTRLLPGGVLACNVGGLHALDPVVQAVGATMAAEFGAAMALPVPNSRNLLLVARNGGEVTPERLPSADPVAALGDVDRQHWQGILTTAQNRGFWRQIDSQRAPLHDDRPELDQLLAASYIERDDPEQALPCNGPMQVAGAEAEAVKQRQRRDWLQVLEAVKASSAPSAYLRELAGDARWGLRQLRAAAAEWAQALTMTTEPDAVARLEQKRSEVLMQQQPLSAAAEVARRNGWLQLGLTALAVLTAVRVWRAQSAPLA